MQITLFFMALFFGAVQGTLIPKVAHKLDLLDNNSPVLKIFNDYKDESANRLMEIIIGKIILLIGIISI